MSCWTNDLYIWILFEKLQIFLSGIFVTKNVNFLFCSVYNTWVRVTVKALFLKILWKFIYMRFRLQKLFWTCAYHYMYFRLERNFVFFLYYHYCYIFIYIYRSCGYYFSRKCLKPWKVSVAAVITPMLQEAKTVKFTKPRSTLLFAKFSFSKKHYAYIKFCSFW